MKSFLILNLQAYVSLESSRFSKVVGTCWNRGVHGTGRLKPESGPACFGPGLDLKFYYSGKARIIYLAPFNKWAGCGLTGREPKPSPTVKVI